MDPKKLSIEKIQEALRKRQYICDRSLATVVYLAMKLGKPLLLEGEAGVGKTEIAKVLAEVLETGLIRLQCYEGLDATTALYEWNYPKQMLRIKLEEVGGGSRNAVETEIFTQEYLIKRPLLEAIQTDGPHAAGAVDRRDRSRRHGVRGLPPGGPFRFPDHHPGDRDDSREATALCLFDLPTGPARSTTPSSAAACTTGSIIPVSTKNTRSSRPSIPRSGISWRVRFAPSCIKSGR